jgi:phosphatidylinositol-binding clathrin assembly protein
MSRPDAERALSIYRNFVKQTEQVIRYLSLARQYERFTRLEVPKLKHAPTSLSSSLEEYLNDPDFEINRRQYLAQSQGTKASSKSTVKSESDATRSDRVKKPEPAVPAVEKAEATTQAVPARSGPAPDLIDFFDSIEQNQQSMANPQVTTQPFINGQPQAQQYQQPGFNGQQTGQNPFWRNQQQTGMYGQHFAAQQPQQPQLSGQLQQPPQSFQQSFSNTGFGGQPYQQSQAPQISQPSQTPQTAQVSLVQTQQPQLSQFGFPPTFSSTPQNEVTSFNAQQQPYQQQAQPPFEPIQAQATTSNPFRQSMMPTGASTGSVMTPPTLLRQSTNPFSKTASPQPAPPLPSISSPFSGSALLFAPLQSQTQQQELQQTSSFFPNPQASTASPIPTQKTGTNPFARNAINPAAAPTPPIPATVSNFPQQAHLFAQPTGTTNPFRQSQFVSQPTGTGGSGWPNSGSIGMFPGSQVGGGGSGTFGGYDVNSLETVPVFPRSRGQG